MYSASMVESATVDCLLDCHDIGPFARMNTYPEVDLRSSGSAAKLASE
jgi:hypothetical protein